jgi:hypothetical protein
MSRQGQTGRVHEVFGAGYSQRIEDLAGRPNFPVNRCNPPKKFVRTRHSTPAAKNSHYPPAERAPKFSHVHFPRKAHKSRLETIS